MVKTVYERIGTYETVGNVYDKICTYETITSTSSAAQPTPTTDAPRQEETSSKDKSSKGTSFVNKGGQNMATAAGVSNFQESSKLSLPVCASEFVHSSEVANVNDSVRKKTPQLHGDGHYGTVYKRIVTYETVGNVYDKIGTYETITPTSSTAYPNPRTDAATVTQEETASKGNTSEGASVNEGHLNMAGVNHLQESFKHSPPVRASESMGSSEGAEVTDSVHKKTPQPHGEVYYEQLGNVYERIATYETVGNVYDKICTYETIGNVYDNSLVPKLGFHETSL